MKHKVILIASILVIMCGTPHDATSQWIRADVPYSDTVASFGVIGTNLFAGTYGGSVFLSTNNGSSWTAVNTGLTVRVVFTVAVSGTNLFAGGVGVFLSTDNGTNWTASVGLSGAGVHTLAVSGTNIFAGTENLVSNVLRSTNNGASWTEASTGLPSGKDVYSLVTSGTTLFAGTRGAGVYLSKDDGTTWTAANTGLAATEVSTLAIKVSTDGRDTSLFAGTPSGIFLSSNQGTNWTAAGLKSQFVQTFAVQGTNLFAGTWGGVFLSTDNGGIWTPVNTSLATIPIVISLAVSGEYLLTGTLHDGVWRRPLSDFGSSGVSASMQAPRASTSYPNPANEKTTIGYTVTTAGMVSIEVFDALSKSVAVLVHQTMQPGNYETTFDAHARLEGVYYYRLDTGGVVETKKLVVVR